MPYSLTVLPHGPVPDHTLPIQRTLQAYRRHLAKPDPAWPWQIQTLIAFVNEHLFDDTLTVAGVREACGIKDKNVSALFAHYFGLRLKSYIVYHRLEAAKTLLWNERWSITQVAFGVGYASSSAFATAFKHHVGCTPSAFRQQRMEVLEDVVEARRPDRS